MWSIEYCRLAATWPAHSRPSGEQKEQATETFSAAYFRSSHGSTTSPNLYWLSGPPPDVRPSRTDKIIGLRNSCVSDRGIKRPDFRIGKLRFAVGNRYGIIYDAFLSTLVRSNPQKSGASTGPC